MDVPDESRTTILQWCQSHYGDNLVGLAFFDPRVADPHYPSGDINVLLIVRSAPAEARERYDVVAEELVKNLIPEKSLTCRIQTAGELYDLVMLRLPLAEIYLTELEIAYDPHNVLHTRV